MTLYLMVGALLALCAPTILCLFSIYYVPGFIVASPLARKWPNINLLALGISALLVFSSLFIYSNYSTEYAFMAALSCGVMGFVAVQSFSTDFAFRLVDRRMLRIANAISLIAGLWFLISFTDSINVKIYLLLLLGVTVAFFIPAIGQSDTRAMQLIVLSIFPVTGLQGISHGFLLTFATILLYGIIRGFKEGVGFFGIFTKMSMPMVPLIVAPFTIVVLINPLLPA